MFLISVKVVLIKWLKSQDHVVTKLFEHLFCYSPISYLYLVITMSTVDDFFQDISLWLGDGHPLAIIGSSLCCVYVPIILD